MAKRVIRTKRVLLAITAIGLMVDQLSDEDRKSLISKFIPMELQVEGRKNIYTQPFDMSHRLQGTKRSTAIY